MDGGMDGWIDGRMDPWIGYVPTSFGIGVTIPLLKDKISNVSDVENYHGITLSLVISRLFEMVLLAICGDA